MLKNKIKKDNGFTIIEVMIVLAIAGLILLVVFLAVPALQRSARNTQRKDDVAAILSAVSEYENNNSGALPSTSITAVTGPPYQITVNGTGTASSANIGYYNQGVSTTVGSANGFIYLETTSGTVFSTAGTTKADYVIIAPGDSCGGANDIASAGTNARAVAVVYGYETSSGYVMQCQSE